MIGTEDEQHYWDCHDAAAEVERLRGDLEVARLQGEAAAGEAKRLRLTNAEREAVEYYIGTGGPQAVDDALRRLLERTK